MVQLTEVPDEHFETPQPGPEPEENEEDFTDTDSEISTESDYDPQSETLSERLAALRDIIPPTTRSWISSRTSSVFGYGKSGLWFAGQAVWVISSTAILLGVPFALCQTEEQNVLAMEQEYKMREMGGEMLTADSEGSSTAQQVGAALGDGRSSL